MKSNIEKKIVVIFVGLFMAGAVLIASAFMITEILVHPILTSLGSAIMGSALTFFLVRFPIDN